MSLSVDDLVNSFSSSHIGQEAIDLAALHAQLAQTLFGQTPSSTGPRQVPHANSHTCTTPTTRTPSSSFSFSHMAAHPHDDSMDEDEQMVEELLMPASPSVPTLNAQYQYPGASQQSISPSSSHLSSYVPVSADPSPSSSVFTSTDPFYLAAMQQQQQQQQQSSSFFAQSARLSQNSPFFNRQSPQHRENHHPLTIDTHSIFASAAY